MRAQLLALVAVAALLTGCGEESAPNAADDPTSSASATPTNTTPACEDIWVEGEMLPETYDGCGGTDASPTVCESGQMLFTYADSFYATPGGKIAKADPPLKDDQGYQDILTACG